MPTADEPQRESKHTVIRNATDRVFQQIGELEELIETIANRVPESIASKAEKTPAPCLAEFLNDEAERLGIAAGRIEKAVTELRSLLF